MVDSNFCSLFKGDRVVLLQYFSREKVILFPILFLVVSLLFSFNNPKKVGRALGVQVIGFMSRRDKVLLHGLFMFKESRKNLIHYVSKSLDLCRAVTRDCLMVFLCLRSCKRT